MFTTPLTMMNSIAPSPMRLIAGAMRRTIARPSSSSKPAALDAITNTVAAPTHATPPTAWIHRIVVRIDADIIGYFLSRASWFSLWHRLQPVS